MCSRLQLVQNLTCRLSRPTYLPTQVCVTSGSPCPDKKEDVQCCSNECVDGTGGKGGDMLANGGKNDMKQGNNKVKLCK